MVWVEEHEGLKLQFEGKQAEGVPFYFGEFQPFGHSDLQMTEHDPAAAGRVICRLIATNFIVNVINTASEKHLDDVWPNM